MTNTRGPRPLPNAILNARGSTLLTKDREDNSPKSPTGPQDPPEYLSEAEADKWRSLVPVLLRMKVFSEADIDAVVRYCKWWVQIQELEVILADEGYFLRTENREKRKIVKKHPAFDMISELAKRLKDLDACFGLTPSARSRIDIKAAPALPTATKKQPKHSPLKIMPKSG